MSGSRSGGTVSSLSPRIRREARLVASTFNLGATARRAETDGPAGKTCSKLSSSEEHLPLSYVIRQRLLESFPRLRLHAERLRDLRQDKPSVRNQGEVGEEHPVTELFHQFAGELQGKPRLARAARSGEREERNLPPPQELSRIRELLLPPDERGWLVGYGRRWLLGSCSEQLGQGHVRGSSAPTRGVRGSAPNPARRPASVAPPGTGASASDCRPDRYNAKINCARSPSRKGCSRISASTSPARAAWRPRARSASILASRQASRRSSSRPASACANAS